MPRHTMYGYTYSVSDKFSQKKSNAYELALMSSIWFVFDEYFMRNSHGKWIKKYFFDVFSLAPAPDFIDEIEFFAWIEVYMLTQQLLVVVITELFIPYNFYRW